MLRRRQRTPSISGSLLQPLLALGVVLLAAGPPMAAQAFTLVGTASVSVNPTSGVPSAGLKANGRYGPGPCQAPLTFKFYWDTTLVLFWSTTVPSCVSNFYDTGSSPGFVPIAGYNDVGPHTVIVNVADQNGALMPNGSATTTYTIKAPPPPPPKPSPRPSPTSVRSSPPSTRPTPSSTPSATPSTDPSPNCTTGAAAGCPSPSAKASACGTAGLPTSGPTGTDVAALVGGGVLAAIPITGLVAMVFPGLLRFARWKRIAAVAGLAVLLLSASACESSTPKASTSTPVAATAKACSATG